MQIHHNIYSSSANGETASEESSTKSSEDLDTIARPARLRGEIHWTAKNDQTNS